MIRYWILPFVLLLLFGCGRVSRMTTPEYQERPTIEHSLFKSDQEALSEETIAQIFASKLELPGRAKIALMMFSDRNLHGYYWWRLEEERGLYQGYIA